MLLAIDCGNTNTTFAIVDDGVVKGAWRTSTNAHRTADEYAVWLTQLMALEDLRRDVVDCVVIANVVPDTAFNLRTLCRRYFDLEPMIVGSPEVDLGISVLVEGKAGADRLANAVGSKDRYKGPVVVVDFGTATNFDVIDADGNYEGGIIAPGINLSMEALYRAAAQLPKIMLSPPPERSGNEPVKVIGKNTYDAMHAGVFWGYVGLIDGLIQRIKDEYGSPMTVVATGGLAALFAGSIDGIDIVDNDITLHGLIVIHRRNTPK